MIDEQPITLWFDGKEIEARISSLTDKLADEKLGQWWQDEDLKERFDPEPIDRRWNVSKLVIEYEGRILASERVAVVTGEGEHLAVEGAMLISTEPIESKLQHGRFCLLLELLFTAPRNRPDLRLDERSYVTGVGLQLLKWGVRLSREKGCEGCLRLDASPDSIKWYEKRGLQKLKMESIVHEGAAYTPMELSIKAAERLTAE